jgi:serine/threonine protein kinase
MYSLGIIFFEMCFAFKTHMERVHILTALRTSTITFPDAWPVGVRMNQREIVTWLLRHDPSMRPQANQLLTSPLLPAPEKQKEYYDLAIAGASDHPPFTWHKVKKANRRCRAHQPEILTVPCLGRRPLRHPHPRLRHFL